MKVILLCAGEIGFNSLKALTSLKWLKLEAVFSYRLDAKDDVFFTHIKHISIENSIPFFEDSNISKETYYSFLENIRADYLIAIKWRTLIPEKVLNLISKELIVFHASLLPKYRGFAPVNWPIINGEKQTGLTMFYGAKEVDSGDIIDQSAIEISNEDDAYTIDRKISELLPEMLKFNLTKIQQGIIKRVPQNHNDATYCIWREEEDGKIDWAQRTIDIHNLIRGLTRPYPGAFTFLASQKLRIWRSEVVISKKYIGSIPGKIESIIPGEGVNVLTGDGILRIKEVQLANGPVVNAAEVIKKLRTKLE